MLTPIQAFLQTELCAGTLLQPIGFIKQRRLRCDTMVKPRNGATIWPRRAGDRRFPQPPASCREPSAYDGGFFGKGAVLLVGDAQHQPVERTSAAAAGEEEALLVVGRGRCYRSDAPHGRLAGALDLLRGDVRRRRVAADGSGLPRPPGPATLPAARALSQRSVAATTTIPSCLNISVTALFDDRPQPKVLCYRITSASLTDQPRDLDAPSEADADHRAHAGSARTRRACWRCCCCAVRLLAALGLAAGLLALGRLGRRRLRGDTGRALRALACRTNGRTGQRRLLAQFRYQVLGDLRVARRTLLHRQIANEARARRVVHLAGRPDPNSS